MSLAGSIAVPLLLAALLFAPGGLGRLARLLAPWAAAPALAAALLIAPGTRVELPWLVLGAVLGVDAVGRTFLLLTALLWTAAGLYARAYLARDGAKRRFFAFFLLAMAGNLWLTVAQDIASFYTSFTLMTFAGYGLVVHQGGGVPMRAGRVYMVLALLAEAMLIAALLLTAHAAGGLELSRVPAAVAAAPERDVIIALALGGFGVKAGAVPLHVWLPLAHPVAPTPASAVLSGCMIKAGLLGWLRFLPLGQDAHPGWASLLVATGFLAAFYGVAIGLLQTDPKTNLAYSSISQMGLMQAGVGLGLGAPEMAPMVLAGIPLYALHHGLAKGALFLGVGLGSALPTARWQRPALMAGLVFCVLAMAGAPFTSGLLAKDVLKGLVSHAPGGWSKLLDWLLPLSGVATTLLLGRFLWLVWRRGGDGHLRSSPGLWGPGGALFAAVVGLAWLWAPVLGIDPSGARAPYSLWAGTWPIVAGGMLLLAISRRRGAWLAREPPLVAPGDLLVLLERAGPRLLPGVAPLLAPRLFPRTTPRMQEWIHGGWRRLEAWLGALEDEVGRWDAIGVAFLLLVLALAGLLAAG